MEFFADIISGVRTAADIRPVSYTHLDVYKRQAVLWTKG